MASEFDDVDPKLLAMFAQYLSAMGGLTGANSMMGFGQQRPQIANALQGQPHGTTAAPNSGWFPGPVGGPGQPTLGANFAPSGVLFGGGSPFPVDTGPAQLQNAIVGLRDLMNTPLGQQAIGKLKEKMGYKP